MKEFRTARLGAVIITIVMLAAGACSSGKSASASSGAGTPTPSSSSASTASSSGSATDAGSASGVASSSAEAASASSSSSAGPYGTPAAACPLVPAASFAGVSGISDVAAQEIPASPSGQGEVLVGCKYTSGSAMIGATTVDIAQAQAGESAEQYLSHDIASTKYNFGLSKDVSGVGDAAKFGTASCSSGTCASLWLVQIRSGMVAHLTVSVTEDSGAEEPVIGLAKALLASVSN